MLPVWLISSFISWEDFMLGGRQNCIVKARVTGNQSKHQWHIKAKNFSILSLSWFSLFSCTNLIHMANFGWLFFFFLHGCCFFLTLAQEDDVRNSLILNVRKALIGTVWNYYWNNNFGRPFRLEIWYVLYQGSPSCRHILEAWKQVGSWNVLHITQEGGKWLWTASISWQSVTIS